MPNAINISASSMTGLLGAVEASKAAHSRARTAGSDAAGAGLGQEYDISRYRKRSALAKSPASSKDSARDSNKGVKLRAMKDKADRKALKFAAAAPSVQEQLAMDALQRKSKIYEATILGKKGGLSEKQLEACPLDVEAKRANLTLQKHLQSGRSDSDEADENEDDSAQPSAAGSSSALPPTSFAGRLSSGQESSRPPPLGEDQHNEEDWVETQDEFGRDVLVLASSVKPSQLDPQRTMGFAQTESAREIQETGAQYGAQTYFPILELPEGRPAAAAAAPVEKYFDATAERRQLGTGFYALSSDPAERQRQQAELRAREAHTNQLRAAAANQPATPAQIAIQARKRQLLLKKEELARKRARKSESD